MTAPTTLSWLAGAVAGRSLAVLPGAAPVADSDGVAIRASIDADWRSVAAQAALIAAGTYAPEVIRQLIGRPVLAQRYAVIELTRATAACRDRLPTALLNVLPGDIPATASAAASLALARTDARLPPAPHFLAQILPLQVLARSAGDPRPAEQGAAPPADEPRLEPAPPAESSKAQEDSILMRLFANPLGGGRSGDGEHANDAGGGETPVSRFLQTLRRGVDAVLSNAMPEAEETEPAPSALAWRYPEWDIVTDRLRPDHVTVEESEPAASDAPQDRPTAYSPSSPALRRQLAMLGLDHEPHGRQRDGADLDTAALIDTAIDLHAGHEPANLNIYRATRRTRRDLSVVIVLDASGSTDEAAAEASSAFELQAELAFHLAHAFSVLGDATALFAFQSWGRSFVRSTRLKRHDEPWSGRIADRMHTLEPQGFTRTGAAVRHATRRLTQEMRLPNRLLILITDGVAYDRDYEGRMATTDTEKAVEAARASGCACVCLTISSAADVQTAMSRIGPVCRAALASVSKRRPTRRAA